MLLISQNPSFSLFLVKGFKHISQCLLQPPMTMSLFQPLRSKQKYCMVLSGKLINKEGFIFFPFFPLSVLKCGSMAGALAVILDHKVILGMVASHSRMKRQKNPEYQHYRSTVSTLDCIFTFFNKRENAFKSIFHVLVMHSKNNLRKAPTICHALH